MKVFLVDVDNVLFDTERIRHLFDKLTVEEFTPYFKEHIFPDSLEVLKKLKEMGKVIIFSRTDHPDYQAAKIKVSGIEEVVGNKNIVTMQDKIALVEPQIKKLQKEDFDQIYIIDDKVSVLEEAHRVYPETVGILITYGIHQNTPITDPEAITYRTNFIKGAYDFISSYVGSLENFIIKRYFTEKQIDQLIKYSNDDLDVQKNTIDATRFKDKTSFDEWLKKGKFTYVLSDKDDNLCGLIWFSEEILKDYPYPYTFAIRTYGDTRGKGLAQPFMDISFKDFGKKGIWLTTSPENIPAVKLYKNFGFKEIPDENPYNEQSSSMNKIVMVLE